MTLRTWLVLAATLGAYHATTPRRPATRPAVAETRLRIIGTNDFHGALEARPDASGRMRGGAGAFAAAIEHAEAECKAPACYSILLDGGDEFQGTPASNLAYGRPVSDMFNRLGYAAAALGNHEWDWGQDTLRARMAQEHYHVLGANVRWADGRSVSWLPADTIVVRGPARVGVIGITTRTTVTSTKASNIQGLVFVDPAPIVDSLTVALRARGATVIVVVAHAGAMCPSNGGPCTGEIIDLARHLTQHVDAIVAGHSHTLVNTVVNDIPIVEARSSGQAIDVVDIPLEPSGPTTHEVREVYTDSLIPDPKIAAVAGAAVQAVAARVNRTVATIAEDMRRQGDDYALGKLVADAMRVAGRADFGVMNHGGIRADLRQGTATYGALFEISPFGNYLYRITARGADMRRYFEVIVGGRRPNAWISGVALTYDTLRSNGARITAIDLPGGRVFSETAMYSVVINDFMLTGGSGLEFPAPLATSEPLNIVDLDALVTYLETQPQPIVAPADVRLRVAR